MTILIPNRFTDLNPTVCSQASKNADSLPFKNIIFYNTSGFNTDRSIYVVPRRAYLDNRTMFGEPRNMVVIIAEIHYDALESIVACKLNQERSNSIRVVIEHSFTGWVKGNHKECTHRIVVVQCLDFPTHAISNGSSTGLIYKKKGEVCYSYVETEKPLKFQSRTQSSTPTRGKGSIFACCTLYSHPKQLHDWLRYQKTLGVDFVHLNVDTSFAKNAMAIYPFLNESLHNGFVQMEVWNNIVGPGMYYRGQITKYQDCLYRYIGEFEFGIFLDSDDFFNPVLPGHKDIHYYFNVGFSNHKAGSICFSWVHMHCAPIAKLQKTLADGNLTSILSGNKSVLAVTRKCAHRMNATVLVKIHETEKSFPGYEQVNDEKRLAYVAHNSIYSKPC